MAYSPKSMVCSLPPDIMIFFGHTQIYHGDGINKFNPQHATILVRNTVYTYSRNVWVWLHGC